MALTERQVLTDISEMAANLSARTGKYVRNLNRYLNNSGRGEDLHNLYGPPPGYWFSSAQNDTQPIPVANVLRSMVDTLCSKLAQTKVRPFFNPVNGTWKTRKSCRATQQFFDLYFEIQNAYGKKNLCRRDAAIFDTGVMRINEETESIDRILPWNLFFDRAEFAYDHITRYFFRFPQYELAYFMESEWADSELKNRAKNNPIRKCTYDVYYDLMGKKKWHVIDSVVAGTEPIDFDVPSFVMTFNTRPVKGAYSTSVIDNQWTIQTMIDMVLERIELAAELTPANMILVPTTSGIKKSMVTNEIGAMYEYGPSPVPGAPIQVVTPPPISEQYMEFLKYFIELAYNLEGISQLSAQSKKPSGLDSGVALQTVEDVESDRFETLLQEDIRFMMDITDRCISCFPQTSKLLASQAARATITWAQIKQQREHFSIQFAPSSALSKDPMVKMQQVEKLRQMGVIPEEEQAQYLELPDLEKLMGKVTAAEDVVEAVIQNAVDHGIYEYDQVVPAQMLQHAVLTELYQLLAYDDSQPEIERLREFYQVVLRNNAAMQAAATPPPQPPQGPAPAAAPPASPPAPQPMPAPMPAAPVPPPQVNQGMPA